MLRTSQGLLADTSKTNLNYEKKGSQVSKASDSSAGKRYAKISNKMLRLKKTLEYKETKAINEILGAGEMKSLQAK